MKELRRREVERELARRGCVVLRTKGGHVVWGCPCGRHQASLPRHRSISPGVVRSLGASMSCLPSGWLA